MFGFDKDYFVKGIFCNQMNQFHIDNQFHFIPVMQKTIYFLRSGECCCSAI